MTAQRLYLETMEEILKNTNKVIIDNAARAGTGVLPYLPLPALPVNPACTAQPRRRRQPSSIADTAVGGSRRQ